MTRKETIAEGVDLYLGDCREILPTLGKVDSIIADLPYGVTQNRWDNVLPLPSLWEMYHGAVRPGGVICLFGAEPFSSKLRLSSPHWKYDWYWEKERLTNISQVKRRPGKTIETISVFYNTQCIFNPQMQTYNGPLRTNKVKNGKMGRYRKCYCSNHYAF